jgi:hypothetical protein
MWAHVKELYIVYFAQKVEYLIYYKLKILLYLMRIFHF